MTTFYICRHGETENNRKGRLQGWIDTPLTDVGIQSVLHSAATKLKGLRFDCIYSSDLGRAFMTAYLITRSLGCTAEINLSKGLRESSYGELGGMLGREAEAQYPGLNKDADFVPPSGESLSQMQERVLACLSEISNQHPGQTILLSSHDGPINAIYAKFADANLGTLASSHVNSNDFVAKFTFEKGGITSYEEVLAI